MAMVLHNSSAKPERNLLTSSAAFLFTVCTVCSTWPLLCGNLGQLVIHISGGFRILKRGVSSVHVTDRIKHAKRAH